MSDDGEGEEIARIVNLVNALNAAGGHLVNHPQEKNNNNNDLFLLNELITINNY